MWLTQPFSRFWPWFIRADESWPWNWSSDPLAGYFHRFPSQSCICRDDSLLNHSFPPPDRWLATMVGYAQEQTMIDELTRTRINWKYWIIGGDTPWRIHGNICPNRFPADHRQSETGWKCLWGFNLQKWFLKTIINYTIKCVHHYPRNPRSSPW